MKIFIGYDSYYPEVYEVCKRSIQDMSVEEHEIFPLVKKDLINRELYYREPQGESTEFAFTRFLVPHLCNFEGHALFCDVDFLWKCDPIEIADYVSVCCNAEEHSIHVVKHPQLVTRPHGKMMDKTNRPYDKKYWSSLMYFNNEKCKRLNIDYVSTTEAGNLHGFKWLDSDDQIGELPVAYNMLVGYYNFKDLPYTRLPKAIHFTDGGPWLKQYRDVDYAKEWIRTRNKIK